MPKSDQEDEEKSKSVLDIGNKSADKLVDQPKSEISEIEVIFEKFAPMPMNVKVKKEIEDKVSNDSTAEEEISDANKTPLKKKSLSQTKESLPKKTKMTHESSDSESESESKPPSPVPGPSNIKNPTQNKEPINK